MILIPNSRKLLLLVFFIFTVFTGCNNKNPDSNTNALQATPEITSPGETISLTFPQDHPAYLAIRDPAGAWYSIQSPDDDVMMLTPEKYSATTNLSLHTQTLEGVTWVEGVKTKELVFKTRGEYLVYMADNLETEPENTFHFMTYIQLK